MNHTFLSGLIAAPFTPMNEKGKLNLEPIAPYVDWLVNTGVKGAFICGTTGEGPSLRFEEKKVVFEEWVRCSDKRLKVIAHVGGTCYTESIELAKHAENSGVDAIAAMAPNFFRPTSVDELLLFLKSIAEAAPELPFYYYHIPSVTGVDLPVHEILSGADDMISNLAGVKFTHSNLMDLQQCLALNHGHFDILFGSDEILLSALSLGVKSAVGSTYNYMAPVYVNLIEAFNNNDLQDARKYQELSVKVVHLLNKYGGGVRAGKAIMELVGIECGPCRLPIRNMTTSEAESLKNDLLEIGFFEMIDSDFI